MRQSAKPLFFSYFILALFFSASLAHADPINFIAVKTHLSAEGKNISFKTETGSSLPYRTEDPAERITFTAEYFDANFIIENKGSPCAVSVENVTSDTNTSVISGNFHCSDEVVGFSDLRIESRLFLDLFQDVNHFVNISLGGEEKEALLTDKRQTAFGSDLSGSEAVKNGERSAGGIFSVIRQFIGLGVPHVLFGFDHVLFILAVHLIVRKYRDIFIVVTSFTLAHSLTLILASFGLITITSSIVEPLIAFTIAYTAVRNIFILMRGKTEEQVLKERWISAFGFGLIHGLGFAGALSAIKIPHEYFIPALLSFNVGVEIGQLIVIVVFVSFLTLVKKRGWFTETIYGLSGAITVIASIWMVQRIFS